MPVLRRWRWALAAAGLAVSATTLAAQSSASDEEVSRRQLESGRAFARQAKYQEALKDFRAVADTHATSSVADDALLEIARYYLDIAGDTKEASTAVDAIQKTYPTSDSAPEAYLMAGRLALAKSHQPADLDAALANFDRVVRLFPNSDAVARSLALSGQTLWYAGRFNEALAALGRVGLEYSSHPAAAEAYLASGQVMVSLGEPISAMEELQQVRTRWPASPEAETALARITLLHRLYVRATKAPAYALSTETVGPAKLSNVVALTRSRRGDLYWATENAVGTTAPASEPRVPALGKPRGLALDAAGMVNVLETSAIRPLVGTAMPLLVGNKDGQKVDLDHIDAAVALSNGDWVVMDGGDKYLLRFSRTGAYIGGFATAKVSRLAVNAMDEVAGLDADEKSVDFFDAAGKLTGRLPFRGTGYDLQNPEDLAYDAFGHLYVLDRGTLAVFSPYPAPGAKAAAPAAATAPTAASRGAAYRLLTTFSEPEKSATGFHRATSLVIDPSGGAYLYDERAERVLVYR
jgi:TolA-binding protein